MEQEWNKNGTRMEQEWNKNGKRMEHEWNKNRTRTEREQNENRTRTEQELNKNRMRTEQEQNRTRTHEHPRASHEHTKKEPTTPKTKYDAIPASKSQTHASHNHQTHKLQMKTDAEPPHISHTRTAAGEHFPRRLSVAIRH